MTHPSPVDAMRQAMQRLSDLAKVEEIIQSTLRSDSEIMVSVPTYLLSLGGKRIRPALTLLSATALIGEIKEEVLQVAAGIELIHMATLLHDDIIDHSTLRRHKPSPLAKFGVPSTLLSGDFLLVRAFGLCAKLPKAVIEATELACIELVEGESLETPLTSSRHTLDSSLTIARKKTASLFRLGAFSAAHLSKVSQASEDSMLKFGENLGIAFQILDDILDVTSSEGSLGKKPGTDIIERKPSVINVLWLESGDPLAIRLRSPVEEDEAEFVEMALKHLLQSNAVSRARELARHYAEEARHALHAGLGKNGIGSQAAHDLETLIEFTLDRIS